MQDYFLNTENKNFTLYMEFKELIKFNKRFTKAALVQLDYLKQKLNNANLLIGNNECLLDNNFITNEEFQQRQQIIDVDVKDHLNDIEQIEKILSESLYNEMLLFMKKTLFQELINKN